MLFVLRQLKKQTNKLAVHSNKSCITCLLIVYNLTFKTFWNKICYLDFQYIPFASPWCHPFHHVVRDPFRPDILWRMSILPTWPKAYGIWPIALGRHCVWWCAKKTIDSVTFCLRIFIILNGKNGQDRGLCMWRLWWIVCRGILSVIFVSQVITLFMQIVLSCLY